LTVCNSVGQIAPASVIALRGLLLLVVVLVVRRVSAPLHVSHVSKVLSVWHVVFLDMLIVSIHVWVRLIN
jgi:hypothetical protein